MSETITVDGITYRVLQARTAEEMRADGLPTFADLMEQQGVAYYVNAQRPKGRKVATFYAFPLRGGRFQFRLLSNY